MTMPRTGSGSLPIPILLFILLIFVVFALVVGITGLKMTFIVGAILGIAIFVISFVSPEAALCILIFSMLLSPEFGQRGTKGGGFTLRADDLLLLLIGFSWFARSAIHKELGLFLKTPLNLPIRYYALACFVSTVWGFFTGKVQLTGFLFIVKYIEYFIVYFMVVNHIQRREQIRAYYLAALVTALIVSLMAIAQIPGGERVTAPFEGKGGEPNTLGGYLVLLMSLVLGVFLEGGSSEVPGGRFALLGLFLLMAGSLTATQSRGAWIAATAMMIAVYFLYREKGVLFSARKVKIAATFVAFAVLLLIFSPANIMDQVKGRILYTFMSQSNNPWVGAHQEKIGRIMLDTSTSERIRSWKSVWREFQRRPFLGYGVTGWRFLDNQYARTFIETGVIGLLAFLILLWAIYRQLRQVYQQMTGDPFYRGIVLGTRVGLIALMAHAISANTFIIVRIMEPFWLFVGMVMVMPRLKEEQTTEESEEVKKRA